MKRIILLVIASIFVLAGCQMDTAPAVDPTPTPTPTLVQTEFTAVSDVSFTGSAAATKDEAINTAIGSVLASVVFAQEYTSSLSTSTTLDLQTVAAKVAELPYSYDISDFNQTTVKGSANFTMSDSYTSPAGPQLTLSASGKATLNHDLNITNGGTTVSYPIENGSASVSAEASASLAVSGISQTTNGGKITIEKAVLDVDTALTASVSNLNVALEDYNMTITDYLGQNSTVTSQRPAISSGTFSYNFTLNLGYTFVMSSTDSAYKGGKVLLKTSISKGVTDYTISSVDDAIYAATDMTAGIEDEINKVTSGGLGSLNVSVYVLDADNNVVYEDTLTGDEIRTAIEAYLTPPTN